MSRPSPKSESESPVTIPLIDGSQRMRSLSSRPGYAWMPNGHGPGPWNCPSPSPARNQARSSLSMPRTRSGSTPNFSTQSCHVSAGGVCTGRPSRRASRSWYGAVRTTAVARSRSSSGTASGSNRTNSSPSSTAYDETSSGHHCSSFQSGCGDCHCQIPGRTSRTGAIVRGLWFPCEGACLPRNRASEAAAVHGRRRRRPRRARQRSGRDAFHKRRPADAARGDRERRPSGVPRVLRARGGLWVLGRGREIRRPVRGVVPLATGRRLSARRGRARLPAAHARLGQGVCDGRLSGAHRQGLRRARRRARVRNHDDGERRIATSDGEGRAEVRANLPPALARLHRGPGAGRCGVRAAQIGVAGRMTPRKGAPTSPYPPDPAEDAVPVTGLDGLVDAAVVDADWANRQARGAVARRAELRRCRLTGAELAEAALTDVTFEDCRLDLAGLRIAKLERVVFRDCRMAECDLYEASLTDVLFERCELREATLTGVKIKRVELRGCDLTGLHGAEAMRGTRMPWNDVLENGPLFATALGLEIV